LIAYILLCLALAQNRFNLTTMPLSYLAVLKRSLFSSSEPTTAPETKTTSRKDLKDDWILVHDEENSQTEELIDLTDQTTNYTLCGTTTTNSDGSSTFHLDEAKQREILLNRDLWLQKQNKMIKSLNMTKNLSKLNRSKIMKRKRNSKSNSSGSSTCQPTGKINQDDDNLSQDLDKQNENDVNATSERVSYQTRKNFYLEANGHALNKTCKKMKSLQNIKKSRMITQPMAKCLC